jgi:hypothetical protein
MVGISHTAKPRGRGIIVERALPRNSSRRWRYLAQRTLSGTWLDRSGIPILSDTLTWDLQTNSFQGTINPQYYGLTEPGTSAPIMQEWATTIYAECDGIIQWGGLLSVSDFTGPEWVVNAIGFRGYPNGQIFEGSYSETNIDPLVVNNFLWSWLQTQENGNLGVEVYSNVASTPIRLGNETQQVQLNIAQAKSGVGVKNKSNFPVKVTWTVPSGSAVTKIEVNGKRTYEGGVMTPTSLESGDTITAFYTGFPNWTWTATEPVPFQLQWYNGTDIGQEISALCSATPMDMVEAHNWNADKTNVNHSVTFGYPRVGVRQNKLRFVEGENITVIPQLSRDGTQYNNSVLAYGAGSGSTVLHWNSGLLDNTRLRRSYAYTNSSITQKAKLESVARKDAMSRVNFATVMSVQVSDHPNAPIGSFHAGDDILIQLLSGWMKGQRIWHRITAYSYSTTTNTLVLTLARSDSFTYSQGDLSTVEAG